MDKTREFNLSSQKMKAIPKGVSFSCGHTLEERVVITAISNQGGWDHLHGSESLMGKENNEKKNKASGTEAFYFSSSWVRKVNLVWI